MEKLQKVVWVILAVQVAILLLAYVTFEVDDKTLLDEKSVDFNT